jgi:hypothetical protein
MTDEELKELKQFVLAEIRIRILSLPNGNEFEQDVVKSGIENLRKICDLITVEQQRRAVTDEEVQRAIDLISSISGALYLARKNNKAQTIKDMNDALRLAITALHQMQGWIPVSEYKGYGLYVPVLQWDENCGYCQEFAYYDNQRKSWAVQDETDEPILLDNVTHYFNLPEAPNKKRRNTACHA